MPNKYKQVKLTLHRDGDPIVSEVLIAAAKTTYADVVKLLAISVQDFMVTRTIRDHVKVVRDLDETIPFDVSEIYIGRPLEVEVVDKVPVLLPWHAVWNDFIIGPGETYSGLLWRLKVRPSEPVAVLVSWSRGQTWVRVANIHKPIRSSSGVLPSGIIVNVRWKKEFDDAVGVPAFLHTINAPDNVLEKPRSRQ